ncbi:hypothetical protein BDN71DRAFT_1452512 [Pleurotus eryngii]|uniref:Uncharacterized protein n=1 Tax=Pleurotus eryngii TaxID=5323 RepID=A0A9P5ZPN2_PLEER|nr:hypothetical protein BDN71DRAFT_1452512 [Pleurotus eryngii]
MSCLSAVVRIIAFLNRAGVYSPNHFLYPASVATMPFPSMLLRYLCSVKRGSGHSILREAHATASRAQR